MSTARVELRLTPHQVRRIDAARSNVPALQVAWGEMIDWNPGAVGAGRQTRSLDEIQASARRAGLDDVLVAIDEWLERGYFTFRVSKATFDAVREALIPRLGAIQHLQLAVAWSAALSDGDADHQYVWVRGPIRRGAVWMYLHRAPWNQIPQEQRFRWRIISEATGIVYQATKAGRRGKRIGTVQAFLADL
jgi:hypothetical protein